MPLGPCIIQPLSPRDPQQAPVPLATAIQAPFDRGLSRAAHAALAPHALAIRGAAALPDAAHGVGVAGGGRMLKSYARGKTACSFHIGTGHVTFKKCAPRSKDLCE
jgi:hypothetical protein